VREYPTCKFDSFSLAAAAGERARFTFNIIPDRLVADDSGTNKLATLGNITRPSQSEPIEFNVAQLLMNDQSAGALSGSDEIFINNITLNANNNLRAASVTTRNAPYVDEPLRNSWFEVGGSFTLGELEDFDLVDDNLTKVVKKMSLTFTSNNLVGGAGSTVWSLTFLLPSVQIENANPNIGGPEVVEPVYNFQASLADSVPTGFSDVDAILCRVVNSDSTNALTGA
jgi:hypothetical protein